MSGFHMVKRHGGLAHAFSLGTCWTMSYDLSSLRYERAMVSWYVFELTGISMPHHYQQDGGCEL